MSFRLFQQQCVSRKLECFFGDDHVFFSPEDFGSTICLVLFQAFSKKIWALPKGSGIQRWEKENHQPRQ